MSYLESVFCKHDGVVLHGKIGVPNEAGPHPAVMIVHSAFGLGSQVQQIALRLVERGYLALAVDMYGGGTYTENPEEIAELVRPLWGNAGRLRSRMNAWHQTLKAIRNVAGDRIAALGYCFGGQCVLEFARGGGEVKAVLSFHGILSTDSPAMPGAVHAHVSIFTGACDPHAPREQVETLRRELVNAGASWHISEFGNAYHAFTEPEANTPYTGRAYDLLADRVSWESTLTLLNILLGEIKKS